MHNGDLSYEITYDKTEYMPYNINMFAITYPNDRGFEYLKLSKS